MTTHHYCDKYPLPSPYSPDLASSDFFLVSKTKTATPWYLSVSSRVHKTKFIEGGEGYTAKRLYKVFQRLKQTLACIASNGAYFEGDIINIDDLMKIENFI